MAILYRHIRLDRNEPFYIGIGLTDKRAYSKKDRNSFWKHVVSKSDYEVEIIMTGLSWEEGCEKEKEFIELYGRRDLGTGTLCNLTTGGDGISNLSQEARHRIGNGNRGVCKSEEIKRKISAAKKNIKKSSESVKKSIETRIKNGSIKRSSETRLKIALHNNRPVIGWKNADKSDAQEYPSVKIAQKQTGYSNISSVCNGYRKSAGGYFWRFK